MSWGDQILDELGLVDLENRKSISKMDKEKLILYSFILQFAKKHGIKLSDEELEKEIEEFLKN